MFKVDLALTDNMSLIDQVTLNSGNINFLKALGPIRGTSCLAFGATEIKSGPEYWTIGVVQHSWPNTLEIIHTYTIYGTVRMHRGKQASIVQYESSPWRVNFFTSGDWVGSFNWYMYTDILGGGETDLCETTGDILSPELGATTPTCVTYQSNLTGTEFCQKAMGVIYNCFQCEAGYDFYLTWESGAPAKSICLLECSQ